MKEALLVCSIVAAWPIAAGAQQAVEDNRTRGSDWSADIMVSWSDNYRRLPELLNRFDVDGTTGDVTAVAAMVDPPSNTIVSSSLSGTSFIQKDNFAGFLTGSLRVGTYVGDTDLDSELVADSDPAAPFPSEPTADGSFSTFGFSDPERLFIEPNLAAAGTVKLSDQGFFLDGSALARQQSVGAASTVSQQSVGNDAGTSTSLGASISPYYYQRWDDQQQMELRLRGTVVEIVDESIDDSFVFGTDDLDGGSSQFANNSRAVEASGYYDTGGLLGNYALGVSGYARSIREDGSDRFSELNVDNLSARLGGAVAVSNSLRLTGGVGIDDISIDTDGVNVADATEQEDEFSGMFWDVGLEYQPSRRISVALSAGQRFGGPSFTGEANVALTRRTSLFARADTAFDTGAQQFSSVINSIQSESSSLLSALTGQEREISAQLVGRVLSVTGVGQGIDAGFRQGAFVFERYVVGLVREGTRTSATISAGYEQVGDGDDDSESYSFSALFDRRLSRRLSFNANYDYSLSEGLNVLNAVDDTIGLTGIKSDSHFAEAGLSYAIGRRLSASASVYYTVNNSDVVGPSISGFDFDETGVLVGLRYDF